MTHEQWATLGPLRPADKKPGRPPVWSKRRLINGIHWQARTGAHPGAPARPCARGQGLGLPRQLRLPAQARNPEGRPSPPLPEGWVLAMAVLRTWTRSTTASANRWSVGSTA
ncbi:transposase [Streptomyces sp. NPDC002287]